MAGMTFPQFSQRVMSTNGCLPDRISQG
jgi:hypothetical protein